MKRASVTEARNNLSALLDQVKEGETILITEHGKPVARLEPMPKFNSKDADEARIADLERRGIVIRHGTGKIPKWIIDTPPPKLPKGMRSLVDFILEEREEGW
jgi:prevent-host-death family protein